MSATDALLLQRNAYFSPWTAPHGATPSLPNALYLACLAAAPQANPAKDDFLRHVESAEARDETRPKYMAYQRSQREQIFTGNASQPVGGRMQRQFKLHSSREEEWSKEDEAAFQKAFGRSSRDGPKPTGF